MAYRVIRENNRSEGFAVLAGEHIIAGAPVMIGSGFTVKKADGAAMPYGLACESTDPLPMAPASGPTAGQGYDYTNWNRGGKVAAFVTGSELELFDDGHGKPFNDAATYAINGAVYANASGLVDSAISGPVIGHVVDFDASAGTTRLRVKFVI